MYPTDYELSCLFSKGITKNCRITKTYRKELTQVVLLRTTCIYHQLDLNCSALLAYVHSRAYPRMLESMHVFNPGLIFQPNSCAFVFVSVRHGQEGCNQYH